MKKVRFLFCFAVACAMTSSVAYAYIDPASTSYVIQIIAGVVLAGGAAIGIYWHKIKRFFKNRGKKDQQK